MSKYYPKIQKKLLDTYINIKKALLKFQLFLYTIRFTSLKILLILYLYGIY